MQYPHTEELKKSIQIYLNDKKNEHHCKEIFSRLERISNEMFEIAKTDKGYAEKLENWASSQEGCSTVFLRDVLLPETSYDRDSNTSYGISLDWNVFVSLDSLNFKWNQLSFALKKIYHLEKKEILTEQEERCIDTEKWYLGNYEPYKRFCSYNPDASFWNY